VRKQINEAPTISDWIGKATKNVSVSLFNKKPFL
jgi:hypothetical protein